MPPFETFPKYDEVDAQLSIAFQLIAMLPPIPPPQHMPFHSNEPFDMTPPDPNNPWLVQTLQDWAAEWAAMGSENEAQQGAVDGTQQVQPPHEPEEPWDV